VKSTIIVGLAFRSLLARRFTAALTVITIAISVALFVATEQVLSGARSGFEGAIRGVDLIVGARTGPVNLVLYSVFRIGSPTSNMTMKSYERFAAHPAVEWTIPIALGDSFRGFRVAGTTAAFYEHYRFGDDRQIQFREGNSPQKLFDAAIGSDVADRLGLKPGQKIVLTHGISQGAGILNHDELPFQVCGIMHRTGTPVDRTVFISLEALEAIHLDWHSGAPPAEGEETPREKIEDMYRKGELKPQQITAFYLRTKNRFEVLRLQREIQEYRSEALTAAMPGVALQELWQSVWILETALRIMSLFIVAGGLSAMMLSLFMLLDQRRKEMAILRALGAGPRLLTMLMVAEAGLLSAGGAALGLFVSRIALALLAEPFGMKTGFYIRVVPPGAIDLITIPLVTFLGMIAGLFPALQAVRRSMQSGLYAP
jgi:putative ABC transport system permease protein